MPDYVAEARRAARSAGIDPNLFVRQINAESGFNPHARSPAGALGIAQIVPATAQGWGVNPHDPIASLHAAAHAMRRYVNQFGSYRDALIAYNAGPGTVGHALPAETSQYVSSILNGSTPRAPTSGGSGGGLASALQGTVTPGRSTGTGFDPGSPQASLADLLSQQSPVPVAAAVPSPPAQRSYLRMSVQSPVVSPSAPQGGGGLDNLLSSLTAPQELPSVQTTGATSSVSGSVAGGSGGGSRGSVRVAPGANRPGVSLTPGIMRVASLVAGRIGHPLTVGTGTNHNRMTVDGNVSDHWSGNAVDIPTAPGDQNIRLGRNALLALGVPRDQALSAQGGIYNVPYGQGRRIQVIFNTNEGGDHHNHLHLGVTPVGGRR